MIYTPEQLRESAAEHDKAADTCNDWSRTAYQLKADQLRAHAAALEENAKLRAIEHEAYGLTFGEDWNKGTHAKAHRAKLIALVKAYRADFPKEPR